MGDDLSTHDEEEIALFDKPVAETGDVSEQDRPGYTELHA
jgi:hypothetical protein